MSSAKIKSFIRYTSMLMAVEAALAVGFSYYLGFIISGLYHFPLREVAGLWCAISSIVVISVLLEDAIKAAGLRLLGSLFGGVVAWIVDYFMGYNLAAVFVGIFVTVICASIFKVKKIFRLAALTVSIITIVGIAQPQIPIWVNSFSRVFESLIGIVVTLIVVYLLSPLRRMTGLQRTEESLWKWLG